MTKLLIVDGRSITLDENQVKLFLDRMNKALSNFTADVAFLAPTFERAAASLRAFSRPFYRTAELAYIERFGKLPGSMRTKRLRLKREKRVLAWFLDELERYREEDHGN